MTKPWTPSELHEQALEAAALGAEYSFEYFWDDEADNMFDAYYEREPFVPRCPLILKAEAVTAGRAYERFLRKHQP